MKDVDLATLVAVFQEMLGPLLWVLVGVAAVATLAFVAVLLRERGLRPRRLVWAELLGLAGGVGAVLFVQTLTHSGFGDIGGPIDWVLLLGIFAAGTVGTALGAYALLGMLRRLA